MNHPDEIFPILAFEDNYIWVIRSGKKVVVVDPGDSVPVVKFLNQEGLQLVAILITHHHSDHIGGIQGLIQHFSELRPKVFGPEKENVPFLTDPLNGDEIVQINEINIELQALSVSGHTKGHLAYYGQTLGPTGSVFCGDTLFGAGCGRLFEGTPTQLKTSLERLKKLPSSTLCYCAHEYTLANLKFALAVEPRNVEIRKRLEATQAARERGEVTVPFSIEGELLTNPFFRWDAPEVRKAASERLGRAPTDSQEVFTTIRQWKDHFRPVE